MQERLEKIQTQKGEFDLSLTNTQFLIKNQCRSTCTKQNSFFEFDLSLTKIQYSTRK